jgi:hypothetical protein
LREPDIEGGAMGIFSGISNKISKRTQTGRTFKLGNKRVGSWKTPPGGGRTLHIWGRKK